MVAPAFWYLLFGLPGILIYKVINTADSMIGYRTEQHEAFGWAAARTDDVLNFLPARLTALLFSALSGRLNQWPEIVKDARKHRSPNAGWPEAALARALDVSLAGPRTYDGAIKDYPLVNPEGRSELNPEDIRRSIGWLWRVWGVLVAVTLAIAFLA